jgi:hypothetical protein
MNFDLLIDTTGIRLHDRTTGRIVGHYDADRGILRYEARCGDRIKAGEIPAHRFDLTTATQLLARFYDRDEAHWAKLHPAAEPIHLDATLRSMELLQELCEDGALDFDEALVIAELIECGDFAEAMARFTAATEVTL